MRCVLLTVSAVALLALAPAAQAQLFSAPTNFPAGDAPSSVAVGDFNADTDPDLVVANAGSDDVSVLLGGAGGGFVLRRPASPPATNLLRSRWAASTGTHIPISLSPTSCPATCRCCSAARAGASALPTNYSDVDVPGSVAVGDFDGDTHLDLAVADNGFANVGGACG